MHAPRRNASGSKRIIQSLGRICLTAAILILSWTALRKTIAMAQGLYESPMPLPYAYAPSPNMDERPDGTAVNCIVLHATVEPTTEGTVGLFLDPKTKVSAHFVVGKDGRVVQMVPVEKRAWHAGTSVFDGVNRVNDFSVGVEIVNLNDGKDPFTSAQYEAVAGLIRFIRSKYTVPDDNIVSHAQVALPVGRKSDPVGLDFQRVKDLAQLGPIEHAPATASGVVH